MWTRLRRARHWSLMVATALAILTATTLFGAISLGQAETDVVINEVELNPNGRDGQRGVEEWIELFNPTDKASDVGKYKLETQAGYETLTQPITAFIATRDGEVLETLTVPANGYLVLHLEGEQWLDNRDEALRLLNSDDVVLDRTPELIDTDNDDRTWQRVPNGQDTDTAIDWRFRTASRGEANR